MSAKAVAWAWTQKVPSDVAILLQALADEACDLGHCGVHDIRLLAWKCALSERQVYRILKFLRETGRLFVHRQSNERGLQVKSNYELNLDRPADPDYPPLPPRPPKRRRRRRSAKLAELVSGGSAPLAELGPDGPDQLAGLHSDGSANLAGLVPAGSAKVAGLVIERSAKKAEQHSSPTYKEAVVVDVICKEQQQRPRSAHLLQVRDANLVMQLQEEMCLGYGQVITLCEEHADEYLRSVRDYVKARYHAGKVQKGKLAAYFLTVAKKATPESLSIKPSTLDLPATAPARSEEEIAAEAAKSAQHEAVRRALREVDDAWKALDAPQRELLRAQFMAHLAEDNRIVYESLRRKQNSFDGLGHRLLLQWLVDNARLTTIAAAGGGDE